MITRCFIISLESVFLLKNQIEMSGTTSTRSLNISRNLDDNKSVHQQFIIEGNEIVIESFFINDYGERFDESQTIRFDKAIFMRSMQDWIMRNQDRQLSQS